MTAIDKTLQKELTKLSKHVNKALTPVERPLDAQETRTIIMLTHQTKESHTFWNVVSGKLLTINRFTAWKFCILLHKLMHDGHEQSLRDSLNYRQKLSDVQRYWMQQQEHEPMGECIAWYCQVLLTKLQFHDTYIFFKGNLCFNAEQDWDMNICFQLCSDIFDLLDYFLQLQLRIFNNIALNKFSFNSPQAKCRLTALATIVDECDALYYHAVNVMRMLCAELSADDVAGLSSRFTNLFGELQIFYRNLNSLRSVYEFIQIPQLPATAPNFYAFDVRQNFVAPSAPLESDFL